MRVAAGLLLMLLALAGTVFFTSVGTAFVIGQGKGGAIFLLIWSLLGPVFFLGLYLTTGGTRQSPATHLLYLTLIGLSIAAGISLSISDTGTDPELIASWITAAALTAGPVLAGLAGLAGRAMRAPND